MQELRQSTQVLVVIGPAVSVSDGFTPVTTLDLSTADEAELLKHNTSSVTSIAGATFAAITSADGYYVLTVTTSLSDTLGMMTVLINDDSLILPIRQQFMVLSAQEWDRKYTATGQQQLGLLATGTAQSATSTTLVLAAAEAFADDTLNGATVVAYGSTQGYAQARIITDYVSSTDTATVDTWTVTPSGTITYWVFATPPAATGGTLPSVNVAQVSGDATAADTLELFVEALDQATGQIDSGTLAASTITAASIASSAIADTKIATGAITAAKFAAGAIDAAAIADNAIDAGAIAANAITAAKIASAALPASKFDAANPVPANVEQINTVTITGDGSGTPFGVV